MSEVARAPTSRWELPPIDGPVVSRRRGDLDAIEREAWEKGHAEGREAGIALVRQKEQALLTELERRVQRLDEILNVVARPLADLDSEVPRQLASLAGAIARQLVRRALKAHPDEIVAVIRETVALLPMTARDVRVHLHPEDAALIRERLSEVGAERVWSIAEDPILSRGGCRVTSENSSIDAQLEQRMGAAIATLLGDERSGADRQTP
jgi:flagellar assembly protein FliH